MNVKILDEEGISVRKRTKCSALFGATKTSRNRLRGDVDGPFGLAAVPETRRVTRGRSLNKGRLRALREAGGEQSGAP